MNAARYLRASAMIAVTAAIVSPSLAFAQSSPSAFTSGTRYDKANRVVGTIAPDPDGSGALNFAAIRNTYDADGRLIRVEKGELSSWQSESVDPSAWSGFTLFSKVETSYDALDRKVLDTAWGWNTSSSAWVQSTAAQYSYDAVGRLDCSTVRMNPATWSSLPTSACTLATTSSSYGPDRITRNIYDATGQLLKIVKAYGQTVANGLDPLQQDYVTYTYTSNGKIATVKDANANLAGYTYDGFDRILKWSFPDPTTANTISTTDYEAYTYDANSNRLTLRKRDSSVIGYTYDALDRITLKDIPSGTTADGYYAYDAWGRQTAARFGSTSGAGLTQSYDGFGQLTSTNNNLSGTALALSYQWDVDGNRTRLTYPDSNYFTFDYDGIDRQTNVKESGSTSVATVTFDAQGRRSGDTRSAASTAYGYDLISRPTSIADDLAGTTDDVTTTFAYSPASQIVTKVRSNDGYAFTGYATVSSSYAVNGLNQYTSRGAATLSYDANGNLTGDGTSTYTYDVENRLVTRFGGLALAYDPSGRLWQTSGGASGTTRYLYDGDELIAEYDGSGNLLRRYVHGPGEDDPILWYEGSSLTARRSLQVDGQGSIVSIADASGSKVAINSYDEYGNPGTGNIGRFQYTGQIWLPDLGLYYYKARMYAPTLGRFMQTDPIGYADQNNLYVYVGNDPLDGTDSAGTLTGSLFNNVGGIGLSIDGVDLQSAVMRTANDAKENHTFRDALTAVGTLAGGALGGFGGGMAGGSGGAAVGLACGPVAVVCSPAGAVAGGTAGAIEGTIGGGVLGGLAGRSIGTLIDKGISLMSAGGDGKGGGGYKSSTSGSGKAKANDVPSWAKNDASARPRMSESPNQSASRVLDSRYGPGKYPKGPGSEFNKIQKWHARGFQ